MGRIAPGLTGRLVELNKNCKRIDVTVLLLFSLFFHHVLCLYETLSVMTDLSLFTVVLCLDKDQSYRRWLASLLANEKALTPLFRFLEGTEVGTREGVREREAE